MPLAASRKAAPYHTFWFKRKATDVSWRRVTGFFKTRVLKNPVTYPVKVYTHVPPFCWLSWHTCDVATGVRMYMVKHRLTETWFTTRWELPFRNVLHPLARLFFCHQVLT